MKSSYDRVIRLIAVFKLLKAGLLIAIGVGILRLLHRDVAAVLNYWVQAFNVDPGNHFVDAFLAKVSNLSSTQIKQLGLGSFVYAALFLTEGIGLWLLKRWAEWLTIVITSSLVPVEIYEIYRHATPTKLAVFAINVAIVWYLIYRVRQEDAVSR